MFLQDNDPHHMHQDFNYVYYFLILAVIFGVVVLLAAPKIMSFLDKLHEPKKPVEKDSGTAAEDDRQENQKE